MSHETASASSMDKAAIMSAAPVNKQEKELGTSIYIDPKAEAKMMRKFDIWAIGLLGIVYMLASLDRSNLSNANIAGMPAEIGLTGNQFGIATSLLFATYVPFEGPLAMSLKVIGPKTLVSVCAFCWGSSTLGMAFIQNYKGLYACRLLIGFFEAGLIPSIDVYLAWVYKREERGQRSAVIFAFSAFSSAFGGILAFGLTQIHGPNGFSGWRWLFCIEGAMTLLFVPVIFFLFPKTPTTAWFLTEDEKQMMQARYDMDASWGYDEPFTWSECVKAFVDPKWYAFWIYQFCVDISLYGLTTFMPAIVKGLGYTSVHANLMTVPIYMCALVFFLIIAYLSDKSGVRWPYLLGPLCCLVLGYVLLIAVDNLKVRFFACFVAALGIYPTTGLSLMWLQDNVARHYKRATMVGFTLCLANTSGIVVGQIFTADSAPRYIKGLSIALALTVLAMIVVVLLVVGMVIVNKKREGKLQAAEAAGEPIPSQPELGDYDPHFRYTI